MGLKDNRLGDNKLSDVSSATPVSLDVSTEKSISASISSVRLDGRVKSIDKRGSSLDVNVFFEWGEQGQGFNNTTPVTQLANTGLVTFETSGVDTSETYEYRAIAEYAYVTVRGNTKTFSPVNPVKYTRQTADTFTIDKVSKYNRTDTDTVSLEVQTA